MFDLLQPTRRVGSLLSSTVVPVGAVQVRHDALTPPSEKVSVVHLVAQPAPP